MPTLHLTCGLPGSGKTTLARQLEVQHHAVRLTADEWLLRVFGDDLTMAENEQYRDRMERTLLDLAMRMLELGVDVILDFGVWSRAEREEFRARAAAVGARSELALSRCPARRADGAARNPKPRAAGPRVSHQRRAVAALVHLVRTAIGR